MSFFRTVKPAKLESYYQTIEREVNGVPDEVPSPISRQP